MALLVSFQLGCERFESLRLLPEGSLRTHYLLDLECRADRETLEGTMSHVLLFNPGRREAEVAVTAYFEDREPERFTLKARPGTTTESNCRDWPVESGRRYAFQLTSPEPVVTQATLGWNNTANHLQEGARTQSPRGPREAATSYLAIPRLATRWFVADGIVMNAPRGLWLRESEWAIVLNPHDEPARLELGLYYRWLTRTHAVEVAPRRLRAFRMDDLVLRQNLHYGVRMASNRPVGLQWRRAVYWHDSPELMTFWSLPAQAFEVEEGPGR
jgi:hypothetical protein